MIITLMEIEHRSLLSATGVSKNLGLRASRIVLLHRCTLVLDAALSLTDKRFVCTKLLLPLPGAFTPAGPFTEINATQLFHSISVELEI